MNLKMLTVILISSFLKQLDLKIYGQKNYIAIFLWIWHVHIIRFKNALNKQTQGKKFRQDQSSSASVPVVCTSVSDYAMNPLGSTHTQKHRAS